MNIDIEKYRQCNRCRELIKLEEFDIESGLCFNCINDLIQEDNDRWNQLEEFNQINPN